jgi:hypothetical protein
MDDPIAVSDEKRRVIKSFCGCFTVQGKKKEVEKIRS